MRAGCVRPVAEKPADVPISNPFGPKVLKSFGVWTD